MRIIKLTQIDSRASRYQPRFVEEGEDDGIADQPTEPTRAVMVNVDAVRSYTARRSGSGTRITFVDGHGFSVAESMEEFEALMMTH